MRSVQVRLLELYFRLQRAFTPKSGVVDIKKEREELDGLGKLFRVPKGVRVERVSAGGVPAEWLIPENAVEGRSIIYLHGGSYCVGSINSHRPLAGNIAVASGSRVLLIDYRLAPEHPLPAGIDDAVTVYKWLVDNGYQPRHIAVAGDSAGGGLALAMLVSLKERGLPQPGACVCLSPWTDLAFTGETWKTKLKADLILHAWKEVEFARMYLGGIDARSPLGSPLYADLKGLPPMLVQVGTDEVLLSDSTRLVERAKEAGVDAELDIWDRMQHVWQFAAGFIPESTRAVRQMGEFIEKRI